MQDIKGITIEIKMYQEEKEDENEETDSYGITVGSFVHFHKNPDLCAQFVEYIQQRQYTVNQFCCAGEGCKINGIDEDTAYQIKQSFLQMIQTQNQIENTVIYNIQN